jgi:hypothetical protein
MPIAYDPAVIESFFDTAGDWSETEEMGRILWLEYAGPTLKYIIHLDIDMEAVGVSGDIAHPFGGDSMYEICVPCSHITSGPDPYHPRQICLSFFYGGSDLNRDRRMTIMKTPTGELKVWPAYPFPAGHRSGEKLTPQSPP